FIMLPAHRVIRHIHVPRLWSGKPSLARFAELEHRDLVAHKADLIVLQNQFAAFTDQFKTVAARGLAGGGYKHSGGAIGPFQISCHVVLHLNIVVPAKRAKTTNPRGSPDQPGEHIQVVRALVEQDAAALPLPSGPPAAAGIVSF